MLFFHYISDHLTVRAEKSKEKDDCLILPSSLTDFSLFCFQTNPRKQKFRAKVISMQKKLASKKKSKEKLKLLN